MIIIGEKLNSSIPRALEIMSGGSDDDISALIIAQNGADYLDVNTALCSDERAAMRRVCSLIRKNGRSGIMLDSPDPEVIAEAARALGGDLILNSATLTERMDVLAPAASELGCSIVVLPVNGRAIPKNAGERIENACRAVDILNGYGVKRDKIFIDVCLHAIASWEDDGQDRPPAMVTLDTIRGIKNEAGVKSVCGLSNISFGLPRRAVINSAFLAAAICAGLDAAICDASSPSIKDAVAAASALAGLDEYCLGYIAHSRERMKGKL